MTSSPWPPAGLAKPAHRALAGAGITCLTELAARTEKEVADLHGMGPNGVAALRRALESAGMVFRTGGSSN